jgi:hypothetical protein
MERLHTLTSHGAHPIQVATFPYVEETNHQYEKEYSNISE